MTDLEPAIPTWEVAPLGDLLDILDRKRVPVNAKERAKRPGKVPYYGATGQVGWIDDYLFDEELILLGEDGAPFLQGDKPKAYVIRGKSWVNNHAHVLRARCATPSLFWKYQLDQVRYRPFVSGTTRLKLSQRPMRQIPLLVPPQPEQHRIVEAIETQFTRLDAAVETLKRVQANLKRYRTSVLKAAVEGRLVPTEAELARQEDRDYEPASVLLERILEERRRRWEEAELAKMKAKGREPKDDKWKAKYKEPVEPDTSELSELPEGWCWATAESLYWRAGYGTSQKCAYDADGPPVLRIPNVKDQVIVLDDIKYATGDDGLKPEGTIEPGDFLFIRTNGSRSLIGRGAIATHSTPTGNHFASYLIRLRLITIGCLPEWFSLAWHSSVVRDQLLRDAASSAGQHNVSLSAASRYLIPIPPLDEQARILQEVDRVSSVAVAMKVGAKASQVRCERLCQSILKWAFEGKLADQGPEDEPASELLERIRRNEKRPRTKHQQTTLPIESTRQEQA